MQANRQFMRLHTPPPGVGSLICLHLVFICRNYIDNQHKIPFKLLKNLQFRGRQAKSFPTNTTHPLSYE